MTPEQMLTLGTAFATYLRFFENCIVYRPTVGHLHSYCRGLLSDLARKSMEPIALACGTAVRTLQEFLSDHVWDHFRMRDQLHLRTAASIVVNDSQGTGMVSGPQKTRMASSLNPSKVSTCNRKGTPFSPPCFFGVNSVLMQLTLTKMPVSLVGSLKKVKQR